MTRGLDESVYPDREPPRSLETFEEKADYVQRVCAAFDFGVAPEDDVVALLEGWKEVFDAFPLAHSPAYHALRAYYGWEARERLPFLGEPGYAKLDALEGRDDGYEERV